MRLSCVLGTGTLLIGLSYTDSVFATDAATGTSTTKPAGSAPSTKPAGSAPVTKPAGSAPTTSAPGTKPAGSATVATGTWQLYQTCAVLGDHDVYVSNKGIKIVDRSTGLTTVASAPNWVVTTYDTKSKTYSQVPLKSQKTYIPDKEFKVTGVKWQNLPLDKELQQTDVAKTPAQGYVTPPSFSEKQFKDRERESADMQFVVSAKYCEAKNIAIPKEVSQILSTYYALPNKGALPLQFRYHDLGGYFHNWLVTSSVQPAAAIDYKPPVAAGFQKLATAFDIRAAAQKSAKAKETKKKVPLL
jgi:hypothetical protein